MADFPDKFVVGQQNVKWVGHSDMVFGPLSGGTIVSAEEANDEYLVAFHSGTLIAAKRSDIALMCRWFLLCENAATHTQSHPTLGEVPICDRCQRRYDSY